MADDPVIILGLGPAAVSAIDALRDAGYAGDILAITAGEELPASPVLTSYYAAGRVSRKHCFLWDSADLAQRGVGVVAHERICRLDPAHRTVEGESGRTWRYSQCLIATGASPRLASAEALTHVAHGTPLALRTLSDAEAFARALECPRNARNPQEGDHTTRVLVSGTSMVALKAAEACLERGASVTLLGRSPRILRKTAHPLAAVRMEHLLEEQGIRLVLGCGDDAPSGGPGGEPASKATASTQVNAQSRPNKADNAPEKPDPLRDESFDAVLVAHGVEPNLGFLEESDVQVDQGIVVDDLMRTNAPRVFAAGDVAQATCLLGGSGIAGIWTAAREQGRIAGLSMAAALGCRVPPEHERTYAGYVPANTIHVGRALFASAGTVAKGDTVAIQETERDGVYLLKAYATRGEREGEARTLNATTQERGRPDDHVLVGFNMVARANDQGLFGTLADNIGRLRAEIVRNLL